MCSRRTWRCCVLGRMGRDAAACPLTPSTFTACPALLTHTHPAGSTSHPQDGQDGGGDIALFGPSKRSKRKHSKAQASPGGAAGPQQAAKRRASQPLPDAAAPPAAAPPLPERAQGEASTSGVAPAAPPAAAAGQLPELPEADDFESLGVTDWLCSVLKTLDITKPTQVQAGCIPAILQVGGAPLRPGSVAAGQAPGGHPTHPGGGGGGGQHAWEARRALLRRLAGGAQLAPAASGACAPPTWLLGLPPLLQGRNVIGTAQTGSGKTAAFGLPILQLLARDPFGVYALVLTPTRCGKPHRKGEGQPVQRGPASCRP